MWLWNRDSEWLHQVATPCNVIRGSEMTCHWIHQNVRHIVILHLVSISTTSPQSTCHSVPVWEILSKSVHHWQKKWRVSQNSQPSWIGFFEKPSSAYITSYRSSIDTIALNSLVFEKIAFFLHFGDRQTHKQTDKQMDIIDACGLISIVRDVADRFGGWQQLMNYRDRENKSAALGGDILKKPRFV